MATITGEFDHIPNGVTVSSTTTYNTENGVLLTQYKIYTIICYSTYERATSTPATYNFGSYGFFEIGGEVVAYSNGTQIGVGGLVVNSACVSSSDRSSRGNSGNL